MLLGEFVKVEIFLLRTCRLAKSKSGDIVLIKEAGAYGFSMSSNYNTRPRICELALENGAVKMVRKRENLKI